MSFFIAGRGAGLEPLFRRRGCAGAALAALFAVSIWAVPAGADDATPAATEDAPWAITVYNAWLSDDTLGSNLRFKADYETDFQLFAVAVSKRLKRQNRHLDFEVEGQVAKHHKGMDHFEFNILGVARWRTFPWDKYLDTSAAGGAGLSYATEKPEFEIEAEGKTEKLLAYLLVELTFGLPSVPNWALVARIHHRSGAWGTFGSGIQGASNALGVGLKYRF